MKNSDKQMMKMIPINNMEHDENKNSSIKNEQNSLFIIIHLSISLKEVIEKHYLHKLSSNLITKELLVNVANDTKFLEIKQKLPMLQVFYF